MANDVTVFEQKEHDFTPSELHKLEVFKQNGLPGITEITSADVARMMDLYLNGSTYTQISNTLGIKKMVIVYLSQVNKWYEVKTEYLREIEEKIKARIIDTRLRNKEFMLLLVQAMQKKMGNSLVKYLATNDVTHMHELDLKEVSLLMKAIDMVNTIDAPPKDFGGKAPALGLNLGEGVTVEKTGDNQVTITPKVNSFGEMLKQLANGKREEEKKTAEPPPKIEDKP